MVQVMINAKHPALNADVVTKAMLHLVIVAVKKLATLIQTETPIGLLALLIRFPKVALAFAVKLPDQTSVY